jgi:hypothetical protein
MLANFRVDISRFFNQFFSIYNIIKELSFFIGRWSGLNATPNPIFVALLSLVSNALLVRLSNTLLHSISK